MNLDRFLTLDDFQTKELVGTTNASADTAGPLGHGSNQVPKFWIILEGDIYVPRHGAGANTMDVRSRRASEAFRMLLFF